MNGTVRFGTRSLKSRPVNIELDKMNNAADGQLHEILLSYGSTTKKVDFRCAFCNVGTGSPIISDPNYGSLCISPN